MKLTIHDNATIGAVQEEFNRMFPFLKIEFYTPIQRGDNLPRMLKDKNKTFGQLRNNGQENRIVIENYTTVKDLDRLFNNIYSLQTLIYRKSGKAWLETKLTDNWTLEEQNKQGEDPE